MNKRILILTGVFLKTVGGPPTILKALNKELIKKGYEITVLTFGKKNETKEYPYSVKVVCDKWPSFLKGLIYLIKGLILGLKSDIIYNQDLYTPGFTGLFIKKILSLLLVLEGIYIPCKIKISEKVNIIKSNDFISSFIFL